jgi:hypothetical protein
MKGMVDQLMTLVGKSTNGVKAQVGRHQIHPHEAHKELNRPPLEALPAKTKEVKPEEVIPLDNEDFRDF